MTIIRGGVLLLLSMLLPACRPAGPLNTAPLPDSAGGSPASAAVSDTAAGWKQYIHPEWGLSFQYPADWQVEPTPVGVALAPPRVDSAPTGGGSIVLEPYTISPGYDLRDWVEMQSRNGEHPSVQELENAFPAPTLMPFAQVGDQVVYAVSTSPLLHTETVWVAQDGLVFRITGFEHPEHRYALAEVVASLAFDAEKLAAVRASGALAGDETALQASMAQRNAPNLAAAEEAIRNRQTAAPPAGATEVYTGASPYGPAYPPFTVQYDPAVWEFVPGAEGEWGNKLQHRQLESCTLNLQSGPTETYGARWRSIGRQWWVEARLNPEYLLYMVNADSGAYVFGLSTPEVDPGGASLPCKRAAEQVLATWSIPV